MKLTVSAHQTTDGTDEHDFGTLLQGGRHRRVNIRRQVVPVHNIRTSIPTAFGKKPERPMPVFIMSMDGHRSDSHSTAVNHADDRPRAHQAQNSSTDESATDHSYRSGPSTESGSS
ncbi:hypothetical protein J1614_007813 [Plenodomus biglobosus]|nr:hypothetical protein J1614_007813 [Plenodomus biglobosus]